MRRLLLGLVALVVIVIAGAAIYLLVAPPALLRLGDGYAAKIVCSNYFLAKRDPLEVLDEDVQAPGNPILKLVRIAVDDQERTVTAKLLGVFAPGVALYRPGLGCTSVPDGNLATARATELAQQPVIAVATDTPWPNGDKIAAVADARLSDILSDPKMVGPGMRAVVIVKDGKIVAETYAPGFDAQTPLLGWSMTKTVTAALLGTLLAEGTMGLDDKALLPAWTDARKDIALRHLTGMSSGLDFNEEYGDVSDVNRMLFLEPDMAAFAAAKPAVATPGTAFNYSSGTGVMLARLWMDRLADQQTALSFPRRALFDPLGMTSAVMEADEHGTFVGSSYMYATARDWARFGQLLADDGLWQGRRLLPAGFVGLMAASNGLPGGYSQMLTWIDPQYGLPKDSFWLEGHDGQTITIIPSSKLVVVRLGLTPSSLGYSPKGLVQAVMDAIGG